MHRGGRGQRNRDSCRGSPRVFEWGYTGGNGRLDKRSTGIGLALCRQAANMLGHSIRIESTKGVGTRVYLCLTHEQIEIE